MHTPRRPAGRNAMNTSTLARVIWEKSRLNLKSEASANYLSYSWWFLEPIIQMACYYIVFELLLHRGGPGYIYFLLVGLVPWLWFARVINQGSTSLFGGRGLMNQLDIPKLFFPAVFVTQCTSKQLLVFAVLLLFLWATGTPVSEHWLASLPVMIVQLSLMIPLTLFLAFAVVFVSDLKFIIPTIIQFLFFCSGIFFDISQVSPTYRDYFLLNPMAGLIHAYRQTLLENQWPDWSYLLYILLFSAVLTAIALYTYQRHDKTIARVVQE